MFGRRVRILSALVGSLLLLVALAASAEASTSGTATLHDGAGGNCNGQSVGTSRGNERRLEPMVAAARAALGPEAGLAEAVGHAFDAPAAVAYALSRGE